MPRLENYYLEIDRQMYRQIDRQIDRQTERGEEKARERGWQREKKKERRIDCDRENKGVKREKSFINVKILFSVKLSFKY